MKEPLIDPQTNRPYDVYNAFKVLNKTTVIVQADCVWSKDKMLTLGKPYVIFSYPLDPGLNAQLAILQKVNLRGINVHLNLKNVMNGEVIVLEHILDRGASPCEWIIVSMDYFSHKSEEQAIRDYCEKI